MKKQQDIRDLQYLATITAFKTFLSFFIHPLKLKI